MQRQDNRANNQLRNLSITTNVNMHAEGSCLIEFGNTKVICTATVEEKVPPFLRGEHQGWLTAEYSMLPRATAERTRREATAGKQQSRTVEIQRLIGRALRSAVDMQALGERTITIDCDVIQADGGTRCASISGGFVALALAIRKLLSEGIIKKNPLKGQVAAVSVGIFEDTAILDLQYCEDCEAETDMNVIMNEQLKFVEIQGTAEGEAFSRAEMNELLDLAEIGIKEIMHKQRQALGIE